MRHRYWKRVPFEYDDAGRRRSKRPRQRKDCTVRALAITAWAAYDEAYDYLWKVRGRRTHSGAHWPPLMDDTVFGHEYAWREIPKIALGTWMAKHRRGVWVCRIRNHVFAVMDGVAHDTYEHVSGIPLLGCWEVIRSSA
jgi:hypothetical protein